MVAYLALGSNLGDRRAEIEAAVRALAAVGRVVGQAEGAGLAEEGDALADVVGRLLSEPGKGGQATVQGGGLKFGEGVDAQCVVDLPDLGNTEA